MKLDPQTTVASLLRALPSAAFVLEKLGIKAKGNEEKSLQEVCSARRIELDEFLRNLDEIDWDKESIEDQYQSHT